MRSVDEPVYATPDPYLRSFARSPFIELFEHEDGVTILRKVNEGLYSMPVMSLYGVHVDAIEEGRVVVSMPASEWFCGLGSDISCQAIGALADMRDSRSP